MPVYYINYLDLVTGFMKRFESESHREVQAKIRELHEAGVTVMATGQYER